MNEQIKLTVRYNLEVDRTLRERIASQAILDRRRPKAEIVILLEEALSLREKRK